MNKRADLPGFKSLVRQLIFFDLHRIIHWLLESPRAALRDGVRFATASSSVGTTESAAAGGFRSVFFSFAPFPVPYAPKTRTGSTRYRYASPVVGQITHGLTFELKRMNTSSSESALSTSVM